MKKKDYPKGRSLEQVMEHCAEVEKHWDDPSYWHPIEELEERLEKMLAEWDGD